MAQLTALSTPFRSIVVAYFRYLFVLAPGLIRALNPVLVRYLRTGLPAGPNALITVRGRRTGLMRSVPSAVMALNGKLYAQASYGDTQWVRNIRAAGEATVTHGGRSELYRAEVMAPDDAAAIMRSAVARFPRSRFLQRVLGQYDRPPITVLHFFKLRVDHTPDAYLAIARQFPLIEFSPVLG